MCKGQGGDRYITFLPPTRCTLVQRKEGGDQENERESGGRGVGGELTFLVHMDLMVSEGWVLCLFALSSSFSTPSCPFIWLESTAKWALRQKTTRRSQRDTKKKVNKQKRKGGSGSGSFGCMASLVLINAVLVRHFTNTTNRNENVNKSTSFVYVCPLPSLFHLHYLPALLFLCVCVCVHAPQNVKQSNT